MKSFLFLHNTKDINKKHPLSIIGFVVGREKTGVNENVTLMQIFETTNL